MSYPKQQRTTIADLSVDGNELFDLSEEQMMMVGGGYGGLTRKEVGTYDEEDLECRVDYEFRNDDDDQSLVA